MNQYAEAVVAHERTSAITPKRLAIGVQIAIDALLFVPHMHEILGMVGH